jgi:predicted metal-binding membrane protein
MAWMSTPAKRDLAIIGAGLALIVLLSWFYLVWMAREMYGMDPSCPMYSVSARWTPGYFFMTFLMWSVMMVAMMVPSAVPMVLTFATISRTRPSAGAALVSPGIFLAGYIVVWTSFSLVATTLQWALHAATLLAPATLRVSPVAGGVLLAAAGIYQFTPLKNACLSKCAGPLQFLLHEWRDGSAGALVMGLRHGVFCTACCAVLMALLFVAGIMNLLWIALIGAMVLVEKLVPSGRLASRAFGLLLLIAAVVLTIEGLWRV